MECCGGDHETHAHRHIVRPISRRKKGSGPRAPWYGALTWWSQLVQEYEEAANTKVPDASEIVASRQLAPRKPENGVG